MPGSPSEGRNRRDGASRRRLLGAAGCAAVAGALAGCARGGDGGGDGGNGGPSGTGEPTGGTNLGSTDDIPTGGGRVYSGENVVVTRPDSGTFRAFSATCTHEGCTVGGISDGTINCPCHGSRFALDDAAVVAGPASEPLPEREVTVHDGEIWVD
ncbi:nitrite reductase/ring-hydroxylating ferredoxin subunit [Haloactinospora alba]|uniref:Cytochrome bc1 complex Rieske iron-sulfur subunit n=1 Tax=Haloactinospora alba TaxID=405555 RepID=A0A543NL96_9ACTN|nr:Rieske (2Fe-2S) protein [Haloactinospora alba]TQN32567.1 nitrite reductase/ring-hydroxylating ferredoxin subunit [Haloactinospora alba]